MTVTVELDASRARAGVIQIAFRPPKLDDYRRYSINRHASGRIRIDGTAELHYS